MRYQDGKPVSISSIVLSTQHVDESLTSADVRRLVEPFVREATSGLPIEDDCVWHVNPTGKFVIGGPDGDAGSRPQDHRRHLWRRGPARRRRVFPARTRPRSIARRPMPHAISPRTSSRPISPSAAPSSSSTPSASPSRVGLCRPARHRQRQGRRDGAREGAARADGSHAARHPRASRPRAPDYAKTSAYGHFGRKPGRDGSFSWERTDLVAKLKAKLGR